jgi:hypothetical protein
MSPKKGTIGPFLGIFNLNAETFVDRRLVGGPTAWDLCLKVSPQERCEATQSGVAAYSDAGTR